ncbi:MAG TPA: hypothetical protein VKA55_06170 [Gammaproteobacteria bacterium]|nr:hypothetical protein [Gammaproteobacteria bacterium]
MTKEMPFKSLLGLIIGGALVLGGCAGQTSKMGDAEKAEQAVAKAESAVKKVREQSGDWGLWKSTLGILGNAKNSLKQGDYKAAAEAANEAKFEADKGLAQYRQEQSQYKLAVQAAEANGDYPESKWVNGRVGEP